MQRPIKLPGPHYDSLKQDIVWWGVVPAAVLLGLYLLSLAELPHPLVLPAVSATLLLAGFATAAGAWWTGAAARTDRIGARDIAGALVLLGFAAALLSSGDQSIALMDGWQNAIAAAPVQ